MNAVEIEEAISVLAEQPFVAQEFPFAFLQAFGNKETTIKRLRKGESNKSDLGGVLQTNNIHIAVATHGEVTKTLAALKEYAEDVKSGRFPEPRHLVAMDDAEFKEAVAGIEGGPLDPWRRVHRRVQRHGRG